MAAYLEPIPDFLCGFWVEMSNKIEEWIPMYCDYICMYMCVGVCSVCVSTHCGTRFKGQTHNAMKIMTIFYLDLEVRI